MGFNIAGFAVPGNYGSIEEFQKSIGFAATKEATTITFEEASESYHGSAPDPSLDVFLSAKGAFCFTSEEGLDQLTFRKVSANQQIIVYRIYEMSMSFYIACYQDGNLLYERVEHEGQVMTQSGEMSIPAGELETDTILTTIKEVSGINFWEIEPDVTGYRLLL